VVRDAHRFVLQTHASNFETGWQAEMVQHKEAFHWLRVQDVAELNPD
jgi:hypothetical protein